MNSPNQLLVLAWLGLLPASGCAGVRAPEGAEAPASPAQSRCEVSCVGQVLKQECTVCHSSVLHQGGLDLEAPGVTSRLVDVTPRHLQSSANDRCASVDKLIDSAAPGESWLLSKVTRKPADCGDAMPPDALAPAALECLTDYVACVAADTRPLTASEE